jgi:hypothetical protein
MTFLLIGRVAAEIQLNTALAFTPAAYSDDGARGKQSSRRPKPSRSTTRQAA